MVYNPSGDKKKWMEETVWVNPVIVGSAEGEAVEEEGCLSFPGMQGRVNRPKWIKIEGKNLKGKVRASGSRSYDLPKLCRESAT